MLTSKTLIAMHIWLRAKTELSSVSFIIIIFNSKIDDQKTLEMNSKLIAEPSNV